jgi:hypothetical protein
MTIPYDSNKLQRNHFVTAALRWPACLGQGEHSRRIAERDGRNEVGIQSVHVTLFSLSRASRATVCGADGYSHSELAVMCSMAGDTCC